MCNSNNVFDCTHFDKRMPFLRVVNTNILIMLKIDDYTFRYLRTYATTSHPICRISQVTNEALVFSCITRSIHSDSPRPLSIEHQLCILCGQNCQIKCVKEPIRSPFSHKKSRMKVVALFVVLVGVVYSQVAVPAGALNGKLHHGGAIQLLGYVHRESTQLCSVATYGDKLIICIVPRPYGLDCTE